MEKEASQRNVLSIFLQDLCTDFGQYRMGLSV